MWCGTSFGLAALHSYPKLETLTEPEKVKETRFDHLTFEFGSIL
jgi:hypothetical protein